MLPRSNPRMLLPLLLAGLGVDFSVFSSQGFEPLVEADLGYLASVPKIPWTKDPFRKKPGFLGGPKAEETALVLEAIIYRSENDASAIINGKEVLPGRAIHGRVVEEIGPNYVLLSKGSSTVELVLPPFSDEDKPSILIEEIQNEANDAVHDSEGAEP